MFNHEWNGYIMKWTVWNIVEEIAYHCLFSSIFFIFLVKLPWQDMRKTENKKILDHCWQQNPQILGIQTWIFSFRDSLGWASLASPNLAWVGFPGFKLDWSKDMNFFEVKSYSLLVTFWDYKSPNSPSVSSAQWSWIRYRGCNLRYNQTM